MAPRKKTSRKKKEEEKPLPLSYRFEDEVVDWSLFPALPEGVERTLYCTGDIGEEALKLLNEKGYTLVDPRTMSRDGVDQIHNCINAWLQGMSEGTIPYSPERRRALELELRSHGLLVNRSIKLEGSMTIENADLEQLLTLGSRHIAVKPITEEQLREARRASMNPGEDAIKKEAERERREKARNEDN